MQYRDINITKIKLKKISWFGINFFYRYIPSIITKKIKIIYLKRILKIQRGFNKFINNNEENLYYRILEDFEELDLKIDDKKFSKLIFGEKITEYEKIIKQHILSYFLNQSRTQFNITRSILLFNTYNRKLIYPINRKFIKIFENNNIPVNSFLSSFCWYFAISIFYLKGVKKILKVFLDLVISNKNLFKHSIYFEKLPQEALNLDEKLQDNENYFTFIINYYKKNNLFLKRINHSINDSNNFYYNNIFFGFEKKFNSKFNFLEKLDYLFWSIKAIFLSLFDLVRGRWWHALLLSEAAERYFVSKLRFNNLHDMYLFSQSSGYIIRPMWTYEAENKGSKIVFYFYSLNYSPITKHRHRPPAIFNSTWSYYIVWNKFHENHLRHYCGINFKVLYSFPTFLNTGYKEFNHPKENFVTIFDITPSRPAREKSTLGGTSLFRTDNCIKFLKTIIDISSKYDVKVILKIKRLHSIVDKKYLVYVKTQIKNGKLYLLNEEVSTISLIKKSKLVISYPITSVNSLASFFNIKNYYYSPIQDNINEELLFNNKIIYDKKDLEKVFENTF